MSDSAATRARKEWWAELSATIKLTDAFKAFEDGYHRGVDKERERCSAVVSLARFGEMDKDFRTIIHFIELGDSIEQIKALNNDP